MEVRARAANQPISPRKVRLVLAMVRGLPVGEALARLEFMPQRAARIVAGTVKSAVANAENNYELNPDRLVIKSATAGQRSSGPAITPTYPSLHGYGPQAARPYPRLPVRGKLLPV